MVFPMASQLLQKAHQLGVGQMLGEGVLHHFLDEKSALPGHDVELGQVDLLILPGREQFVKMAGVVIFHHHFPQIPAGDFHRLAQILGKPRRFLAAQAERKALLQHFHRSVVIFHRAAVHDIGQGHFLVGGHLGLGVLHPHPILSLGRAEQVAFDVKGKMHRRRHIPLFKEHPQSKLMVGIGIAGHLQPDAHAVFVIQGDQVIEHTVHTQHLPVGFLCGEEQLIALPHPVILPAGLRIFPAARHREGAFAFFFLVADAQVHIPALLDLIKTLDGTDALDAGVLHQDLPAQIVQSHARLQGKGLVVHQQHPQPGHNTSPMDQAVAQAALVVHIGLLVLKIPDGHQLAVKIMVALAGAILQIVHSSFLPSPIEPDKVRWAQRRRPAPGLCFCPGWNSSPDSSAGQESIHRS